MSKFENNPPMKILEAFETEPQPLDFVLPGMVTGTVGALVSPGGQGKSMLAVELALTIAGGPDLLELRSLATGKVVYLPAEDPPHALHQRLHALGKFLSPEARERIAQQLIVRPLIGAGPDLMDKEWFQAITEVASGSRLLVLDTLRRFHVLDENASGEMAQVIGKMEHIAAATGCSVLFLHHSSKGAAMAGQGDVQQASRGSSVLVDNIRWQAYLSGMTKTEADQYGIDPEIRTHFVRFGVSKQNYGSPFTERWYRRHEGGVLKPTVLEPKKKKKERERMGGRQYA